MRATASVAIKNIKMYFSIYLFTCLKQLPNKMFTFCVFHIPNIIYRWYFLFVYILYTYKTTQEGILPSAVLYCMEDAQYRRSGGFYI